jgi:hypothetical protein
MTAAYYNSADAGAPVLTGQAGSLINLLDTLLVGSGTAYGSKPKMGWSKAHSGTNKAVYLTADGVANYRVQHDGAQGAASTREAVVRGAESATDVDTLVDAFPTTAQVAEASCVWRVSSTTDSTARPWQAMATPNFLMLTVAIDGSTSDLYMMGRYSPDRIENAWCYLVSTRNAANTAASTVAASCAIGVVNGSMNTRLFAMRSPEGTIKSPMAMLLGHTVDFNNQLGRAGPAAPLPNGTISMQKARLLVNRGTVTTSQGASVSGLIPHLWELLHGSLSGVSAGDTFSVPTDAAAATYMIRRLGSFNDMLFVWETSDTWTHG